MPNKPFVSPLEYDKMTPDEILQAELHGFAALDRAMKSGARPDTLPARKPESPGTLNYIGKEQKDLEGYKIVTGKARYTVDVYFPDMLFVRVKRSPYPHANIKSIDTSKAEAMPGVFAVMTYK